MGIIRRLFGRLSEDEAEIRAADIREWVSTIPGVIPIQSVQPRSVARVAGVVEKITIRPREASQALEAELNDGTGRLTATWLGRRSLPGLTLGARLIVEGRVGRDGGGLQVMNPRYEFTPSEH